ncbi:invasion associated locus B family protein [Pseudochrobactrum sp. HB0163]|uniref:invasion associated locus B family protein n=1 Tax=Pseudochrobactrum sp. HB0163 TaxID=3450708 RepID=UPI003F6E00C7
MQPFPSWTLICDENLAKKQKVCNVSQTIVDEAGSVAFSWSLAAAADGRPFFILRVPASVGKTGSVQLKLADKGSLVRVPIEACDAKVCVAYQQVGPRLKAAVAKGQPVVVSFAADSSAQMISFSVPLEGLGDALAAI